jgi:AsmA family protein
MSRKLYWWVGGTAVAVLLALALIALALYDLNWARDNVSAAVKARTGRDLTIEGDLSLKLISLHPRIRAEQVTFQNVDWGEDAPMFAADSVEVSLSLPSLLRGRLVFHEVAVGEANLLLERDSEGRANWTFDSNQEEPKKEGGDPPVVRQFSARSLKVTVRDAPTETDVKVAGRTQENAEDGIEYEVEGKLRGIKLSIRGTGGAPHTLLDQSTPFPLKLEGAVGNGRISFDGTVTGLPNPSAIDAAITASGRNIAVLARTLKLAAPDTAPYKLKGQLGLGGKTWSLSGISGTVGSSDLRGNVSVDLANGRPMLTGKFESRELDIGDLAGFVGARPGEAKEKAKSGRVLPAEEIRPQTLRGLDAKVSLTAGSFRNRDMLPLDDLTATMVLNEGVMKVEPLRFGVAGGRLDLKVGVDAREDIMNVSIDSSVRGLRLARLIPGTDKLDASIGAVDGRIELKGKGNSAAAVLGTSNGNVDLVSGGGEVSNLVMEVAGLDAGEVLKFFIGGDQTIQLRCGIVAFGVEDGVMASKVIVIDTDDTYIGGEGVVDLRQERMDLRFVPLPKDVSILSLRGPLRARGTFADPDIGVEKSSLARKAGAAIMLGLVNPLLALIPTVETGPGKDAHAPCADLVAELESKVKPGKPKVVPEKRKKELEAGKKDERK